MDNALKAKIRGMMLSNGQTMVGVMDEKDDYIVVTRGFFLREVMTQGGMATYLSTLPSEGDEVFVQKTHIMVLPFELDLNTKSQYIENAFPSPIIEPKESGLIL